MISRNYRFHGLGSVRRSLSGSLIVRSTHLTLRYKPNPKRSTFRLAIVVSKKVQKSAVRRNRIRRRLYSVFNSLADQNIEPYDLVISVFDPKVESISSAELKKTVQDLLKRSGAIT